MWEIERYDWSKLRAMGSAKDVPNLLTRLGSVGTFEEGERIYWQIDNVVIVQGSLYEASLATVSCVVRLIGSAGPIARRFHLELITQIAAGEVDPTELSHGNAELRNACMAEIEQGMAVYLSLIEQGNADERDHCVEICAQCAIFDARLRPKVSWYLRKLLDEPLSDDRRSAVAGWLDEIGT
jgi:hypothetical protein